MIKKSLIAVLFLLALSCSAFANDWDGIEYQVNNKSISFQIQEDMVFFYTETKDILDNVSSITDEDDYYKIMLDSGNFIMLDKDLSHGKVALDNTAYMFRKK